MAKCAECGAVVADDSKFCNYCGAKLNVIGEHLGTQILGNTEVIMGALDRMAPGAIEQYKVVGTATDGPLAGGLILDRVGKSAEWRRYDQPTTLWWSNGEKLTEISSKFVLECFDRGALEFSPELVSTCKDCLTTYHRTRGVFELVYVSEGHGYVPRSYIDSPEVYFRSGPIPLNSRLSFDEIFLGFLGPGDTSVLPWAGESCPACMAETLSSQQYRSARIAYVKHSTARGDVGGWRPEPFSRKAKRALRAGDQWVLSKQSIIDRLRNIVDRCVESEFNALSAFAATFPSLLAAPTDSLDEWLEYQRSFFAATMAWPVERLFTNPYRSALYPHDSPGSQQWQFTAPLCIAAMEDDAEAVSLRELFLRDDFQAP